MSLNFAIPSIGAETSTAAAAAGTVETPREDEKDAISKEAGLLKYDINRWKEATDDVMKRLTTILQTYNPEIDLRRDHLELMRKQEENALKLQKAARAEAKQGDNVSTIYDGAVVAAVHNADSASVDLATLSSRLANLLSPEDAGNISKSAREIEGYLVKDTNDAGNSMNRDAKEIQETLSKVKVFYRLLQQAYKEAQGERKKKKFWLFGAGDANMSSKQEEDEQNEQKEEEEEEEDDDETDVKDSGLFAMIVRLGKLNF